MVDLPSARFEPMRHLAVLVSCRAAQLRNVIDQQLRDRPIRTLAVLCVLVLIWSALYLLLDLVLRHVRGWGLVGLVADRHLFVHFFLVLAIMLAFSNGILTYGTLFGRGEASHLLSTPLHAREVVLMKWFEGLCLSSWSFLLLGVPLMLAIASNSTVQWYFYPLFMAHFVAFVILPGCIGLLAAWAMAMWSPRRPVPLAIALGVLVALIAIYWLAGLSREVLESEQWIRGMFKRIGAARQPLIPSTWTASGVSAAVSQDVGASVFYLGVVLANAAFVSWLTVNILGASWAEAYSRAQHGRLYTRIRWGFITRGLCWALFFYLPGKLRYIMLKDLRGFARDAKQWSQMLIMFGLLVVYVLNLPRLPVDTSNPATKGLIAFLNLTTISLILATFTSRFVYPLLSLESQQLWLLEMLPVRRGALLLVKFVFALTITSLSAGGVMWLAVRVLKLPAAWSIVELTVCIAVCIGLSGLATGLGARFPVVGDRNPARIASGFGGTVNLIVSMLFVALEVAGVAYLSLSELRPSFVLPETLSAQSWVILAALLAMGVLVAASALLSGARRFARLEV
ncbi:MAG: hypothetical protein HRF50_04725 [Phycisphaerae bacterium]|jgi:ABC-2 type transport system permease protein